MLGASIGTSARQGLLGVFCGPAHDPRVDVVPLAAGAWMTNLVTALSSSRPSLSTIEASCCGPTGLYSVCKWLTQCSFKIAIGLPERSNC